jgi:hypothetical protein
MRDDPSPNFWHTTRPHDDECEKARAIAKQASLPMPPCVPGCRVGQPWPTCRLDDARRPKDAHDKT